MGNQLETWQVILDHCWRVRGDLEQYCVVKIFRQI